jgi:mannose-1-phosphate guanylyltransferase
MDPIGLILSAGLGQRLRPLTDYWAKPLIPFLGVTPLSLAIQNFLKLGLDDIWINTHYKANDFPFYVNKIPKKIYINHEPEILGTGGALNFLRNNLNSRDIIIINGDVIADFDLELLQETHKKSKAIATMMLLDRVLPGEMPVWHDETHILGIQREIIPTTTPSNFACAQIISPIFLNLLPENGSFDIINFGYRRALSENLPIAFATHSGFWSDIGSLQSYYNTLLSIISQNYKDLSCDLVEKLKVNETRKWHSLDPIQISSSVLDLKKTREYSDYFTSSIIEENAQVETPCRIDQSIILPGGCVNKHENVVNCIRGPFGSIDCYSFSKV